MEVLKHTSSNNTNYTDIINYMLTFLITFAFKKKKKP